MGKIPIAIQGIERCIPPAVKGLNRWDLKMMYN